MSRVGAGSALPQTVHSADAVLGLQRTLGNASTARILAREPAGSVQSGATPALDERAAAFDAEFLDPSLAPQIASARAAVDEAIKVGGAISSLTPGGNITVPPALKLLSRLWKATDPDERRKWAKELTDRPFMTVVELIDFTGKGVKDYFDVCLSFAMGHARVARHADALFTLSQIQRLEKVTKFLGVATDAFSAVYGVMKLLDSDEKTSGRVSGAVGAATGGSKLVAGRAIAKAGGLELAPMWAIRLTAIGTAVEVAYAQQEALAKMYGKALMGTTAPSVEREYAGLSDAMRGLATARVLARHHYDHWARAQEAQDELATEALEFEFHDALRSLHASIDAALAAFSRLRYRRMKRPYLDRANELATLAEIASADPATGALAVYGAMEELAGALYAIAGELFKDKEKVLKAAAIENADRFHDRPVDDRSVDDRKEE